jgi:hypothetical protein
MNQLYLPPIPQAWCTPGQIFIWLQQQRYQVYWIQYDDQFYTVKARDPGGPYVELKVSPKTRTVFTWKLLPDIPAPCP